MHRLSQHLHDELRPVFADAGLSDGDFDVLVGPTMSVLPPEAGTIRFLPETLPVEITPSHVVLARLARISSGSLTTQLYIKGFRQPVLCGLKPLNKRIKPFAGRAYTMRFIPAREDVDVYGNLTTSPSADNLQWVGVEQLEPGHVLVIDSNKDGRAASMGNMLVTRMMMRGARAVAEGVMEFGALLAAHARPAGASSRRSTASGGTQASMVSQ